jgi:uncharacterized protein (DUF58 family)
VTPGRRLGWPLAWPRRTLWPTRDGWWCLAAALGLGFAAINTGNNLLYLLVSMLLGLVVVSGVLSEQSLRGVRIEPVVPGELFAGRPALFGAKVVNRKRWRTSYSVTIEVLGGGHRAYLPRLEAGGARLVTWQATPPARGRQRVPGFRIMTRFPFGLFVKGGQVALAADVLVYPAVAPVSEAWRRQLEGAGTSPARRRGRGHDLYTLRDYRPGDDPRLIHWKSSAKSSILVVRELQADTTVDTRLVLDGTGARDAARLERGLSEAASLAVHLLRAGAAVELAGRAARIPLATGPAQRTRILTALALYDPRAAAGAPPARAGQARGPIREITVALD